EYLQTRLKGNPKYAADLPLEIAASRLELAAREPEAGKRLALFDQARAELQAFVQKNPGHARAAEARLQAAQVAAQQAKAQRPRAVAPPETDDPRKGEFLKARQHFDEAAKELKAVAQQINTEAARNRADVELGQLLIAKSDTYREDTRADLDA